MAFTLEKLKRAREAGYSDEEILSVASEQNAKIGNAIKSGYTLDDVAEFYSTGPMAQSISEQEEIEKIKKVPEMINVSGGLPVEAPKTKTFMEGEEGKPVEVRRAQAIDIGGKIVQEPISPDGMTLDFRGNLIKEKVKELSSATKLPIYEYRDKSLSIKSELSKLQEAQQKHEANQLDFLSRLITRKPGVSVDVETGLGEGLAEGETKTIPIQTRTGAAIKAIGDQREFIDNIIGNDKFLDYIKTKGIDVPGMMSRMAGQYLDVGEAPDKISQLKQNPEVRKLAEEWAMTTPDFMDTATDIFKRAWDGYAGAIGSGTIGPIGMLLKEAGFEQSGQSLVDAAEYADQQRLQGQDPRKVGMLAQFGRDVSGGLGFTAAAITTGALGNAARASLGLNSAKAISLFQKGTTLGFSGLNSAWAGYSEAKSDGATEDQAKQAALFSALTQAPLELVSPLQKWVSRFDPKQQEAIYKGLNRAAQAVIEGTEEALFNEMPQQIAGNLVKKYVYDPNQDIFDGTLYAGGVGGASGVIASIFTQMIGGKRAKAKALDGDEEGSEETDIESKADAVADQLAPDAVSDLAQQMTAVSGEMDNLKQEIADDEMGLQAIEKTDPTYQAAELALNEKKANLAQLQTQFDKLSAGPAEVKEAPVAGEVKPSATKEEAATKIEELNKEFDALDENDQAGIDRVNKAIFAEQNKIAELTAIEQGIDPQGTTPTRQPGLPESGRRSPFGTFYPDRPVLQAFMSTTDKVIGKIKATGKRAQKLKNSIRTAVSNNAGFLAGTDTQVISSEEYNKLTGNKLSADSGTYKATFLNGKKYLVIPDVNVLQQRVTQGEQRATSRDAALDQESRAAAKKLEEEMIHLSMFQGIQDEYKALKKPQLTEQEYIVKRIVDVAKEVKRTNPNALPGVSEVYLNEKNRNLDDLTFSQEFMRMVAQRVRTGQITEDLNAIRAAEKEAFSDKDKGIIRAWKDSLLNALQFLRTSIARYLGKGTSTKEVEKMLNTMNTILDEYGIVKGEANYEFKDYSAAQPKGELKAEPTEVTPTVKESLSVEPAVSETITEPTIEAKAGETPTQLYAQRFELFNRYTEPMGVQTIRVEATSPDEAKNLIKRTEDYKRIKSRYAKVFELGEPIVVPRPGEPPIIARAGVTPEGEPMSKKSESAMKRISNGIVSDLNRLVESLKPKDNKALKEYKSKTTEKGKTYPRPLISPYSVAANLFTSNAFTAGTNALNKIFEGNPDADFFRVSQDMGGMDEAAIQRAYSINSEEQLVLSQLMYKMMPTFIGQVMDSSMPLSAREAFALDARNVEANLARKVTLSLRESGRKTQYANTLRNIGGAGMAIQSYKSSIIDAMGNIYALTKVPFENIANVIRGDRRKSVDKVANIQSVFRKAVSLIKQSQLNPEKVRQSIRAEVGKKKNASTREILLDFAAGLFDTKEDKYANMIVDQTVQNILAIGMNRKGFSIENVSNFMYQSFAAAAKQMGVQMAGVPKQKAGKRSGKYLEMVKAVIGNDNAYKAFLADLSSRMAEKYQSKEAFNGDFADLFKSLRSNEWSDSLRTQAIKDATDAINYKFADLFQYLGEKRNAAQAGVREHIRAELRGTGASNELIDKFIADADAYLNQETNRILTEKLGFTVNEETGRVSPKPLMSKKIKEEAEAQFKDIKNLKDITKLSLTDEGNFKEGLTSRIITEIGMSKENATELADLISSEMDKALIAQRSENLTTALKKAEEVLTNSKIKRKTNQRTLLQRLIQMANMGMLDSEMVYEAFRQTHDFQKNYLPYDSEFVNTIRQWGDRISLLPEGVIRSIEEEKMGRALLEKGKFTGNDIISSYWYWSLLSQIGTPTLNIISGVFNLMGNITVWSLYSPKTAFPMMQALYSAVSGKQSPAVNSFLYVMRNGLNPSGMQDERRAKYPKTNVIENATPQNAPKIVYYLTNFGDGKINFLPDWFNAVLKNVSPRAFMRSLRATDAFLREAAFEARMASAGARPYTQQGFDIARRQAEQELVSSQAKGKQKEQEIVIRANEIYREQRAKGARLEIAEIEQDALETVYNQDPQGAIGQIANFANGFLAKYKATKYIIPFTNVVANVTNEFINYTPGFSQFRLYLARKNGVNDPFTQGRSDKQWELRMKGILGFAAFVVPLVIQALQSGDEEDQENRPPIQLYAEGPRDPKQQRIWSQNGGIRYSIRIGDKYLSLLPTPLVVPLAMSAMYAEEFQQIKKRQQKLSEIDWTDLGAKVLSSPFSIAFVAVMNQSFLTGVSDILGLTQAKDPVKEGESIIGGIIGRMIVPGQLRDITKLTTNERAVGSTWASNLLKEMPGAINFLNKDVNYFGDPARYPSIVAEEGFGQRLASLFGRLASQETIDPALKIMYDMNLTPPSWDGSLNWSNGKRMTKTQELEFIRSAGPAMRDWIVENEEALRDPELDQEERQNVLSNGISGIRREYKADLETQYQDEIGIDFENM